MNKIRSIHSRLLLVCLSTQVVSGALWGENLIYDLLSVQEWESYLEVQTVPIDVKDPWLNDRVFGFKYSTEQKETGTILAGDRQTIAKALNDIDSLSARQIHPWAGITRNYAIFNKLGQPVFLVSYSKREQRVVRIHQVINVKDGLARLEFANESLVYLELRNKLFWELSDIWSRRLRPE